MASRSRTAQSRYVEANGQRLHYRQWSDEGPPLVLLHGVTDSSGAWDGIAPELAHYYTVMAFDLRGHGLSSKPERGYTWVDHYAKDIVAFLKEQVHEPAVVVGHSLGAVVAVPVAVGAPERVRAIVLEDPPAFVHEVPGHVGDNFRPVLALKRMPRDLRVEGLMESSRFVRSVAERRADDLEAMSERVLLELFEGGTAYRAEDWLPRVSCPSMVILGNPGRGGAVSWDDRPRLVRLLKGTALVEWDDVGHQAHRDQPERFVAEVRTFLQGLSG